MLGITHLFERVSLTQTQKAKIFKYSQLMVAENETLVLNDVDKIGKGILMITHENFVTNAGQNIHVALSGEGVPVILIHGWPEFWMTWKPMADRLQNQGFRLIMPDLYGFGDSDKPNGPHTDHGAEFHAKILLEVIAHYAERPPIVVGHDVGAYVMQALARLAPAQLKGLLFFNCPTPAVGSRWVEGNHVNEIWYQTFHQLDLAEQLVGFSEDTCRMYFTYMIRHWCYRKNAFDSMMDDWVENFRKPGALVGGFNWYRSQNKARLKAINNNADDHPRIKIPTHVYWGRHDPILKSEWSSFLGEVFDDVTCDFSEESGHFVHVENPDEASAKLKEFAKKLDMI